jgi:integrase
VTYYNKLSLGAVPDRSELTVEELHRMLSAASPKACGLLLLNWFHAARVANALDLKLGESLFTASPQGGFQWAITWYRAKTSGKIGPYTTHSWISEEHHRKWFQIFQGLATGDYLFSTSKKARDDVYEEIKGLLPKGYDLRSLRRGALCALARAGTPLDTVMVFSGHTTVRMLLRYLRHGRAAGTRQTAGVEAARTALALPKC